jgi:hypothetical protein
MSDDGTVWAVWAAAARVQTSAESVREVARRLALLDPEVEWRSVAAARFLARLAEQAAWLRATASVVDGAAAAVRAHARAVQQAAG